MRILLLVITITIFATNAFAFDVRSGNSVDISKPVADDLTASGQNVSVGAPITGNAMLAGTTVNVNAPVGGLLAIAASTVTVEGTKQTVFIAGSAVTLRGVTARNVAVAGSSVNMDAPTRVATDAMVAGSDVTSRATIGRNLKVAGSNVSIGGNIGGNVNASGNKIRVLPGTVIRGDFIYKSAAAADIDRSAKILGRTVHQTPPKEEGKGRGWSSRLLWGFLSFLMMLAFGALFTALFPIWTESAVGNILTRPGWSALWGAILLIVTPIAALIAMITVIGLPIGLAIILAYIFTWLLATPISAIALGTLILKRGNIWLRLLVGLLIVYILYFIPFIGGLVKLAVLIFGFGAVWMNVFGPRRATALGRETSNE